jgi:Asp-tRNA(Asn)/Glu-tRNA(Gln) amidotransferase A subunit family amidase
MELTVQELQDAYERRTFSVVEVVEHCFARIEAFDSNGPALNAVITTNARAFDDATERDNDLRKRSKRGLLHGVPVVVKDNFNTVDLPTTNGNLAFLNARAKRDATTVAKLREAGAIVVAKTNLGELAMSPTTASAVGGQTRNPYDLTRTPGGSSGGTGAALAANYAVLGTGTDTGQSSRSPASANSCVALRPTRGLISRFGTGLGMRTQDEAGPLARTVADLAAVVAVVAGYDPLDPITAFGESKRHDSYAPFLLADGLRGQRIGLLSDVVGIEERHREVNAVLSGAIATMTDLGAYVEEVSIPGLAEMTNDFRVTAYETRAAFDAYLAEFEPGSVAVKTLDELVERGRTEFDKSVGWASLEEASRLAEGTESPKYLAQLRRRDVLAQALMSTMAEQRFDALLYPHQQCLVAKIGDDQLERNGVLSHATGLPALTIPGGYSSPSEDAPIGVPIGLELLGPAWSEPLLFTLAYSFEQATHVRRPPLSAPALPVRS